MQLTVNGKPHTHQGNGTLPALLKELGATEAHVATMVNRAVVTKEKRAAHTLRHGDHIDVIMLVGGG